MFETYLAEQAFDPDLGRRRMLGALTAALALSVTAAAVGSGARLQIHRVGAPNVDHIIVMAPDAAQMKALPKPPPPPPDDPASTDEGSDAPAAVAKPQTPRPSQTPAAAPLDDPDAASAPADDRTPNLRPTGWMGDASQFGDRFKPGGPVGRCRKPPCTGRGKGEGGDGTGSGSPTTVNIDTVRARASFTPDPDRNALARTRAGTIGKQKGRNRTSFCIDARGKTDKVRTAQSFGDREVDLICRKTVAKWRFRPFTVDGSPRRVCSEVTFDIDFE